VACAGSSRHGAYTSSTKANAAPTTSEARSSTTYCSGKFSSSRGFAPTIHARAALGPCLLSTVHQTRYARCRRRCALELDALLGGGGLEPGEAVHRDDLDGLVPGLRARGQPLLERAISST